MPPAWCGLGRPHPLSLLLACLWRRAGGPGGPARTGHSSLVPLPSDAEAEDGEQGPIWTFPPTVRPSPHGKLHKGTALHGSQKVCPAGPGAAAAQPAAS